LEERDHQLVSLEQTQAALRLEADTAHRKCEDMRRACDLNLSDLQVESARQLSILRRKNDSLGRENDAGQPAGREYSSRASDQVSAKPNLGLVSLQAENTALEHQIR
jgi:hypothetical protein